MILQTKINCVTLLRIIYQQYGIAHLDKYILPCGDYSQGTLLSNESLQPSLDPNGGLPCLAHRNYPSFEAPSIQQGVSGKGVYE